MAFNKKASETGWFYHAPARPALNEPMGIPPPSQIPGLSGVDDGPAPMETPTRNRILDTDSKYVQLAKRGGRDDLLQFKYVGKPSDQAQSYPRVDWYYLEDIRQEEAEKHRQEEVENRPYEFLLPDYMVHQGYNGSGSPEVDTRFTPKRAPYGFDQTTAFERDDRPTDKTIRLPNVKRDGYGVRQEKQKDRPVRHNVPMPVRGKAPQAEYTQERKVAQCLLPEDEQPIMSKILSYGYAKDWDTVREKWQTAHGETQQPDTVYGPTIKDKAQTEYQAQMVQQQAAAAGKQRPGSHPKSRESEKRKENKAREEQKERELFKMNKFKNVPARTVTQRPAKNLRPSSPPWALEVTN